MKLLFCIILVFFLSGCGTTGQVYRFEDGNKVPVCEIHLNKDGALSYQRGDVKVQMDSRKPTVWERFITPIAQGAAGAAKSQVNLN